MNIVILGAGEIGRHVSMRLSQMGHDVHVIEKDETSAQHLQRTLDARIIRGDGSLAEVLVEAGAPKCDLFVACTSSNNANLVSCALAKKLGAQKCVCRVHPSVERDEWLLNRRQFFHLDHLFSTERLSVIELAKVIRNPQAMVVEDFAQGRIELQQVEVVPDGAFTGKTLLDLNAPAHVRVAAISRGDSHFVPTREDQLEPGDIVTIFGPPKDVRDLVRSIGKGVNPTEETANVVILGGGQYGSEMARVLQGGKLRVRVLEKSLSRCENLIQTFGRDATVINVDATDVAALREERVGEVDFFVSTLADDADNVMACLQASDLGAQHSLTLLHRADYADAIQHFSEQVGIDVAVSPREATLKHLLRFLTGDRYHVLYTLDAGQVLEASIPAGSPLAGKPLKEIDLPDGCVIVGHIHDIHAKVPSADDVLSPGDNIIAMVSNKAKRRFVKLIGK